MSFRTLLIAALLSLWFSCESLRAAEPDFEREIRPLLVKKCVRCHGETSHKGELRLDAKTFAFRGGSGGPVIIAGKSAESEMMRRIMADDPLERMPPEGARLTPEERSLLSRWIDAGAKWEETELDRAAMRDRRAEHWSWKPILRVEPPQVRHEAWCRNEIDRFLLNDWEREGKSPADQADRRTLMRRLTFDLHGLPPTWEETEAFVNDADPQAYERLVDRLLASPRYGERWARHWLDIVHYGDTHGYDKDKPRENAWPYRDYVIRAFNEDKPYARFVSEQIAGDVLFPDTRDGIEALGFLAAGPWDFIGHAEVPETKTDGKLARHLDRDDMVSNVIGTFCSLTIHCAQCHDHKFDPISQGDYYSLQAVFAALDRTDRTYFADTTLDRNYAPLAAREREIAAKVKAREAELRTAAGKELLDLDKEIADLEKQPRGNTRPEFGWHSGISKNQEDRKWVSVDLGEVREAKHIEMAPCYDDFNTIGAGFGFPVRFRVEIARDADFKDDVSTLYASSADEPNPGLAVRKIACDGKAFRYVRVTAEKLAPRQNDYIFALAELRVLASDGTNHAKLASVTSLDSIEAPVRWSRTNLTDDIAPSGDDSSANLSELKKRRTEILAKAESDEKRQEREALQRELTAVRTELAKFPPTKKVYIATVYSGSGSFLGTGASGGRPRPIHVLARGDVNQPGALAHPGAIAAVPGLVARFELPDDHTEGARRAALAAWLTAKENAFTWRSVVNRVWQYHFGEGIVATPNDFGRNGSTPRHAALLDHLAAELRDSGGSLKRLHRSICTSAAYRRDSRASDDRTLPFRRRKLEAEAIRDAVLAVSGRLNLTMGGPGFRDFVVEHPEHSPHYEYAKADPRDPSIFRRSVYRFLVRSQTEPFMTALDCADPSMRVDRRNEGAGPAQALVLLNDGFMLAQAEYFAQRVEREAGNNLQAQVEFAFRTALSRQPTEAETARATAFIREHGTAQFCRLLFNLNEFAFVD